MSLDRTSVIIRAALPDESASIASVLYDAFAEYKPAYTEAAFAATTPTSDQIRERMNEGPVWVAVLEGKIVGTAAAVPKGAAVYVRSMAVLPRARGEKIGERLLRQVEDFALARGHLKLFLSTTPFLARAIRLYEQMGFKHSPDGPHDLFGTPLFTMVKLLTSINGTTD